MNNADGVTRETLVLMRDTYAVYPTYKATCLVAAFYSQRVVLTSSTAARFFLVTTGHFNSGTEQCNIINITS